MQNQRRQSRFRLFASWLKARKTLSVEKRYEKAIDELRQVIKIRKGSCGSFDFEELGNEAKSVDDSQLKNMINAVLLLRETSVNNRKEWSKIVYAVECVFMTPSSLSDHPLLSTRGAKLVILFLPFDLYFNRYVDTSAEPIWCNMQRSFVFNNGSPVVS
jgi:hypothetical protein